MSHEERWQLGGNAPAIYERHLMPAIFGPWAPLLIEQAARRCGQQVLDVACGTGVVARLAAPYLGTTGKVVGLDLNPGMLAVARSLPPPQGATGRRRWSAALCGDAF
jgi:SAM-dependent methyltransferase